MVIVGLGTVGLLAARMACRTGARVIGVDRYPLRTTAAEALGATTILAEPGVDVAAGVRDLTGPAGADAAIEASGSYTGRHEAIRCLRVGGRVATVASYHGQQPGLRLGEEYHRNRITLISSMTVNGCAAATPGLGPGPAQRHREAAGHLGTGANRRVDHSPHPIHPGSGSLRADHRHTAGHDQGGADL